MTTKKQKRTTTEYLALTVLGENKPGAAHELTEIVHNCECHIQDCRILAIGTEFCANMLLDGNWNAIAKLENLLPSLEEKLNIRCLWQRTNPGELQPETIPHAVVAIGVDKPNIVHELIDFFTVEGVNINDFYCDTYPARYSGVIMLSISMSVSIHKSLRISDIREQFLLFCENSNLDGIIEPEK